MTDFDLSARPPLGGARLEVDGVAVTEVTDRAVVSIAARQGGEEALASAVSTAYGRDLPAVGRSSVSDVDNARFLGLQRDQFFLLFEHTGPDPIRAVAEKLGDAAYLSNQSDSWAMLRITGAKCRSALERICPIDLDPSVFRPGAVARTVMEHLGTIIVREDDDTFLLLSARSSAQSFLHAVETSVRATGS